MMDQVESARPGWHWRVEATQKVTKVRMGVDLGVCLALLLSVLLQAYILTCLRSSR